MPVSHGRSHRLQLLALVLGIMISIYRLVLQTRGERIRNLSLLPSGGAIKRLDGPACDQCARSHRTGLSISRKSNGFAAPFPADKGPRSRSRHDAGRPDGNCPDVESGKRKRAIPVSWKQRLIAVGQCGSTRLRSAGASHADAAVTVPS